MLEEFTLDVAYPCIRCMDIIKPGETILAGSKKLLDEGIGICSDCKIRYFPLKVERVIPFERNSKYIFIVPKDVPLEQVDRMAVQLSEWADNEEPFAFIQGGILLVKVDGEKD